MTAIKTDGVEGRSDIYRVDPCKVVFEPGFNRRKDFGDMESLIKSITQSGVVTPIRVRVRRDGETEYLSR